MTVADLETKRARKPVEPPPHEAPPHVYAAIAAVMLDLSHEGIGKDRNNASQGYKFRGVDDVYNALSSVLAKHQLCVLPHMLSREMSERTTSKGGTLFSVTVSADFDLVSALDGSQHRVGPFYGEAMDSGDKATNKAMSAAYKYMAFQTFCIPTEGDNDADAQTHAEIKPTFNASQAKKADLWPRFVEKLEAFADLDELEQWWASVNTKRAIEQMPKPWQEQAAEAYEKKQEALYEEIARK